MSIIITSTNLITSPELGDFEIPRVDWLLTPDTGTVTLERSGTWSNTGDFSCKSIITNNNDVSPFGRTMVIQRFNSQPNKRYIARAIVKAFSGETPSTRVDDKLRIENFASGVFNKTQTKIASITDALISQRELETTWDTYGSAFTGSSQFDIDLEQAISDNLHIVGGAVYIDTIEIFTYVKVPIVNISVNEPLCGGTNVGSSILLEIIDERAEVYTFLWSNGETTKDLFGIPAGIYTINIFEGDQVVFTQNIEVNEPDPITITANVTQTSIVLDVSGGTPGYVYQWADGPQTKDRFNLDPGTYTVTITDANGCQATFEINLAEFRFFFSRNPVLLPLVAASPETKPNLSFQCEVWVSINEQTPEKVITLEQPSKADASTLFNVKTILKDYVSPVLPAFGISTISRRVGAFTRFFLRYAEKFGNPPTPSGFTQNDELYVINGGLSDVEWAAGTFFDSYFPDQKPFLTWQPNNKFVYADQPEHLHYLCNNLALDSFHLKLKIYNADGTEGIYEHSSFANPVKFNVYLIPAGINQLNLYALNGNKPIRKYDLWLEDSEGQELTEVRTYVFKQKVGSRVQYFLFENALGGWDTLVSEGYTKAKMKTRSTVIENDLPDVYTVNDASFEVLSKTGEEDIQITAGYFTNREFGWLLDFSLSKTYYQVRNGRYIPVQVTADPMYFDDFEPLREFTFEVSSSRVNTYTPDL